MKDPNWQMNYTYFLERWAVLRRYTDSLPDHDQGAVSAICADIGYYVHHVHVELRKAAITIARQNDEIAALKLRAQKETK